MADVQIPIRIRVMSAVRSHCKRRGDDEAHYKACLRGIWEYPEADWPEFVAIFESSYPEIQKKYPETE